MTTLDTLRKALEALEQPNAGLVPHDGEWRSRQSLAIDALRADIARLEAAEPVALGAPIAPEHDAELAAHAERAEQLHAEFLLAQKTYAYNTPGIARCARMAATPEGRRLLDAGRVSIGLEPIWEPAFATAPIAPAIPALTLIEMAEASRTRNHAAAETLRWAYALAAERAGTRVEE